MSNPEKIIHFVPELGHEQADVLSLCGQTISCVVEVVPRNPRRNHRVSDAQTVRPQMPIMRQATDS
ncbi:hypothetical protein LC593_30930 [Nostoc sp. CHAB 5844]|nr:hypothetical protein [Nostoc sp. CHAB 5844]